MEAQVRKINRPFSAVVVCVLLSFSACQTAQKNPDGSVSGDSSLSNQPGPIPPPAFGPEPPQKKSVVLVLSPGMARGFFHVGALRALSDAKIPVSAVVGVEMGALVGAIYSISNSQSDFEWKIMKIPTSSFDSSKKLFGKTRDLGKLKKALSALFGEKNIQSTKMPLRIGIWDVASSTVQFPREGKLVDLIAASFAVPGLFETTQVADKESRSPIPERIAPIDEARELGLGPTIHISVVQGPGASEEAENNYVEMLLNGVKAASIEVDRADMKVKPNLSGVSYFDFESRRTIDGRGRSEMQKRIPELAKFLEPAAE